MQCVYTHSLPVYKAIPTFKQQPSNRFAMRNPFSVLYAIAGIGLAFLLTFVPTSAVHAQCNTAPAVGPVNYTINMSGTQAIITQASLAGVVNPVNGGVAPCNAGCELSYSLTGAAPFTLFSVTPLILVCNATTFPFTLYVRAENGSGCASAVINVIVDVNDTDPPTILCPPAQVVFADANCEASIPGLTFTNVSPLDAANPLEYGDNCATPPISYTANNGASPSAGVTNDLSSVVFQLGLTTVTMSVNDGSNPAVTCQFTVQVDDNTDPTWTTPSVDPTDYPGSSAITSMIYNGPQNRLTVTLNCDDPNFGTANTYFTTTYVPVAEDNCDLNPTEIFHDQLNILPWICPTTSHIRRRWRAIDAAGNDINVPGPTLPLAKLDLFVQNTDAPVFTTAPVDVTILGTDPMVCGVDLTGTTDIEVIASSDCQGAPTYTWTITSAPITFGGSLNGVGNNAEQFYVPGVYTISYTATDGCGNNSVHAFTFTVVDDVDPSVTCPANQVLSAVLDNCFQNAIWDEAIYGDNCPGVLTLDLNGLDPDGNAISILTFQGGGCNDQPGFDVDFAPGNWTSLPIAGANWAGAPASLTILSSTTNITIPVNDPGVILFNWAYNSVGLGSTDDFGYTINGTFYPLIIGALGAGTINGSASFAVSPGDIIGFRLLEQGIAPNDPTVNITGFNFFCGSSNNVSFASFPVGVSVLTYKVTDAANNMKTCSFTVTVTDDQDPEITCGGNQTIFSICPATPLPNFTGNIAAIDENCPGYTIAQMPAIGTTIGTILSPVIPVDGSSFQVKLTITDKGGNVDDCMFTVTLSDNDQPVPDVSPLPTIEPATTLGTDCFTYLLCAPTATECNGTVIYGTATITGATYLPNGCGPGQPGYLINGPNNYAILWTYDDGNGNIATQTQQVNILPDTTPPTLSCPNNVVVNTDPGLCTTTGIAGLTMTEIFPTVAPYLALVDQPNPGELIDNCGIDNIGWSSTSGSAANTNNAGTGTYVLGVNTVTYTASDLSGNTASCDFTITVVDNELPTFTCVVAPALVTGSAGDQNVNDCGYNLSSMDTSLDPTNINDNCPGPYTLTYTVTPLFSALFIPGPDPSSLAGSFFSVDPLFGNDFFNIQWTLEDANGNSTTCSYTLTTFDGQPPVITCPTSPLVRTTSGDGIPGDCLYTTSSTEFDPVSITDNCAVAGFFNNYDFSQSLNGEDFPKGSTFVVWSASDAAGNVATCEIEIIVNDDEPPVNIYCPLDVVLPNIAGNCNNDVAWLRPTENSWTDNCDFSSDLTITEDISDIGVQQAINNNNPYDQIALSLPQTSFPVGVTTIVYTATDLSNNSSTCFFTVTILDIEAPTVTCPGDQILGTICAQGTVPDYRPLATNIQDNCPSSLVITQSPAPGTLLEDVPGLTPADGELFMVTITVTDGLDDSLSTDCTFNVTLDEVNLPVPTVASLTNAYTDCGTLDIPAPTANDCGNVIYGIPSQGTLIQLTPPVYRYTTGLYNVVWTYIGASGNTLQGQQIVVEDDITPPTAQCQAQNVNLSSSNPGTVTLDALDFNNGSTDNCAIASYAYAVNGGAFTNVKSFGCDDVGIHVVELRVTDLEGNQGICTTSLTINDITHPIIVGGCPMNMNITTSNNGGYDCYGQATINTPLVTDNCDIVQYSLTIVQPDATINVLQALGNPVLSQNLLKGVSVATFQVTDEHNNSTTCSFTITVTDDQAPQIVCANSGTHFTSDNTPGDCLYEIIGKEFDPVSFTDNCPGSTISNNYNGSSTLEGELLTTGIYTITWTVTDGVGLQEQCVVEITIVDDENPTINFCQTDINQVATAGTCNALVSWSSTYGFDVADNCGIDNIIQNISDPSVIPVYPFQPFGPDFPPFLLNQALFPIGNTIISYTVTDIHGNSSVCNFNVNIIDDQAPSVTCPPSQTLNTVCATGTVPDYTGIIGNISDNCVANLIITQSPAAGTLLSNVPGLTPADGEVFIVTITVSDPNPLGLSDNCSFFVTLNDVNLPIPDQASLPKDSTDCEVLVVSPPTANDCGTIINGIPDKGVQISFNPPLYQFTTGLYTVIWTYVGSNGSVQQVQQIIVEEDLVNPIVTCVNTTINLNSTGTATIVPAQVTGSITDNCGIANVTVAPSSFNCSNVGANIVTLTATDTYGNSSWCMATVTVQDVTPPAFNVTNSTISANCQSIPQSPNVLATDACGVLSFLFNETSTKGGNPANCNFYTYTIVRTWTATDVNNNTSSVQQVINVQDVAAPVWTTAMPDTVKTVTNQFNCTGPIILTVDNAKLFDNCAAFANITVSYVGSNNTSGSNNASGQYPIGNTTLVFTATDPCGNSASKVVIIVVEDKTPPTPVCINSITLPLNPQGLLVIPPQVVDNGSYDNCLTPFSSSDVTLSVFPDTFDCDDAGKSLITTLTVTDLAGNTATCPAVINIIDNTVPTLISCAPDATISCASSIDPAILGEPIITDACGTDFTFTDNIVQIGGSICYRIDRTWLLIDGSGNNITCLQRISVFDNVLPTFTTSLPQDITVQCGNQIPSPASLAASDNCGVPVITFAVNSTKTSNLTCSDYAYTISRIWTATDACLNATVHLQTISIIDTLDPVLSGLPDSITLYTNDFNADSCTVPVVLVAQVDDCQPDSVISITNNGFYGPGNASASGKYPAGLYPITFTATDRCQNSSLKTTILRVIDNSTPTAVCFSQVTVGLNSQGFGILTTSQVDDQSRDNCTPHALLDFELSKDSFDCQNLGTQVVTLTVTDEAGNTNVCTSTVNVTAGPGLEIITTLGVTPETFAGSQDGAISVSASGGSGQFSYLWTPGGAITPSITGLSSGTYTIVITDLVTGCKKTISVFVFVAGSPIDTISGRILTPAGIPVARTYVNMTGTQSGIYYTDVDGYYEFTVPSGSNVTITPFKDTLPANGVTSLDFAIIQQHILAPPNLKPLTTSFQLIAADQNGNNAINGIDIAQFQSTILNNAPFFPNVTSWVFVLSGFPFPIPLEPWGTGWDESITFNNISGDKPNTDFIAVKMGDVTGDVDVTKITGNEGSGDVRNGNELTFILPNIVLETGARIDVPVFASNFDAIRAYQMSWNFNSSVLRFQGIESGALPNAGQSNFGFNSLTSGLVPHLWFNGIEQSILENEVLFTLQFDVLNGGVDLASVLSLGNDHLGRIAYRQSGETSNIQLRFQDAPGQGQGDAHFALIGNKPNPFSNQTLVEFTLPDAMDVKLTVTDLTGRAVAVVQTSGVKGMNAIQITQTQIPTPGLYLYILEAGNHKALGKLIQQD